MMCAQSWRISSSAGTSSFSVLIEMVASAVDRPGQIPMRPVHLRRKGRLGERGAMERGHFGRGDARRIAAHVAIGECEGNLAIAALLVGLAPTERPVAGMSAALCARGMAKSTAPG